MSKAPKPKAKPRMKRSTSLTAFMNMVPSRRFGSKTAAPEIVKPEQTELPQPHVVFKEGYLFKRGRNSTTNWKRRFFKLEGRMLMYSIYFGAEVKATFEVIRGTTVTVTKEFAAHEYCMEVRPPESSEDHENPLYIAADSREILSQWMEAFEITLRQIEGETVEFPPMRARFYEGTLFKTPKVASKWEAKHMELENGVIYYFDAKKGARNLTFRPEKKHINLQGAQIFLNKTDAKGVPFSGKPFQIKEAGSLRLYNLAAPNEAEYLRWLKAIRAWMLMLSPEMGAGEGEDI